jgi:hypothetical protein
VTIPTISKADDHATEIVVTANARVLDERMDLYRELAKIALTWALADRRCDLAADDIRNFRERVIASVDNANAAELVADRAAEERAVDRLIAACRNEHDAEANLKATAKRLLAALEGG